MEPRSSPEKRVDHLCPSAEELAVPVNNSIACHIQGCDKIMKNLPSFKFHLARTHSIVETSEDLKYMNRKTTRFTPKNKDDASVEKRFYCPGPDCPYLKDSKRFFATYQLLRQHYLKMHAAKNFHCHQCEAKYSTNRDLKQHMKECGKIYMCHQCKGVFQKRQSWVNHCRRLNHPRDTDDAATVTINRIKSPSDADKHGSQPGDATRLLDVTLQEKTCQIYDTMKPMGIPEDVLQHQSVCTQNKSLCKEVDAVNVSSEEGLVLRGSNGSPSVTDTSVNNVGDQSMYNTYNLRDNKDNEHTVNEYDLCPHVEVSSADVKSVGSPVVQPTESSHQKGVIITDAVATMTANNETPGKSQSSTPVSPQDKSTDSCNKASPRTILPKVGFIVIPYVLPNGSNATNAIPPHTVQSTQSLAREAVHNLNILTNRHGQKKHMTPIAPKLPVQSPHALASKRLDIIERPVGGRVSMKRASKKSDVSQQKHAVTTQTYSPKKRRAVAETQTPGDFILRQAMESANLPMESRGSQVSPRAKLKSSLRPVKTTETQTLSSPRGARKRVRKRNSFRDTGTRMDVEKDHQDENNENPETSLQANDMRMLSWQGALSDSQTQTMTLLQDFEATIGESASTQTLESFLAQVPQTSPDHSSLSLPQSDVGIGMDGHIAFKQITSSQGTSPGGDVDPPQFYTVQSKPSTSSEMETQTFMPASSHMSLPRSPTQTPPLSAIVEPQVQTEFPDFPVLLPGDNNYMHMETQTSIDDVFDQLLSNMQTQTNQENDLFSDLGFSHIETQTAGDPGLSSVETQTGLQQDFMVDNAFVMDMETQTVGSFGFPLSAGLADSHTQTTWDDLESFVSTLQQNAAE